MNPDQELKVVTASKSRVIFINNSRLVRELFHNVLRKAAHLQVIRDIVDHADLPADIEGLEAEWLVMSLSSEERIPDWVDAYLHAHPFMRFLAISTDSSQVKMRWLEARERNLEDLSLADLIRVLETEAVLWSTTDV
jgi:hypothetical protein